MTATAWSASHPPLCAASSYVRAPCRAAPHENHHDRRARDPSMRIPVIKLSRFKNLSLPVDVIWSTPSKNAYRNASAQRLGPTTHPGPAQSLPRFDMAIGYPHPYSG
ncbi:hypothetical protein Dimus_006425 [Dionaea muscipula]